MTGTPAPSLDRTRAPQPGPVRPFDFPQVATTSLPNGLEVRTAGMPRVPLATLTLILDAGESHLPDTRAGLAVLSGESLDGGTSRITGPELAEAFEAMGTGLSVRTGWDSTIASVTCLADRLPEAGALLAETLLEPAFPGKEVERFRNQRLAAIRQRRMDPGSLANDAAAHFFYSDASPYHRPLAGTEASVEALGPDEIRAFVAERFSPSSAGVIVVGDVDSSEMAALARDHFGDWSAPPVPRGEMKLRPRSRGRRVVVVDRPGSVQSEIRIGHQGASRSTPLFFPLKVFNAVLGGAFTSRLMLHLREDRGFTYGVRSRFSWRRGAGPFTISMGVATEVTGDAVGETFHQVEKLLEDGPSQEEVARARDYIAGIFPLQLETTGQVAARIGELSVYDLPEDFYATYRDRIRSVTPREAVEAGRSTLSPEAMTVVVVGDADAVRGPLEALDLGPTEVVQEIS